MSDNGSKPVLPAKVEFSFLYRGYEPKLTLQGETGEGLLKKMVAAIDKLEKMGAVAPGTTDTVLIFDAEEMVASVLEGETYWKVKGGAFRKFGVTIWKEGLEASGFAFGEMDVSKKYNLKGWSAHCELKEDGKPKKVVKLVNNN